MASGAIGAKTYLASILSRMKVSFVIPAYNEERTVAACIEAIQTEAGRTSNDVEILVVNNASTDRTRTVAEEAGARVIDEPRKGLARVRQTGFEHSSGEIVANIDADVLIPLGWLDIVIVRFARDPDLVALSGPFVYHDLSLPSRIATRLFYWAGYFVSKVGTLFTGRGAMLQGGNFVIRRSALEKAGGFNTAISFYGEDIDAAQRMYTQGRVEWNFRLWVNASGRRLREEGVIRTGIRYALNYFSVAFLGTPATKEHRDIRA